MYVCERERERERERDFASSGPFGHVCLLQLGQGAGGGQREGFHWHLIGRG